MTGPTNWIVFASGLAFGLASGLLLMFNGRIAGFSGVFRGVLMPDRDSFDWKLLFLTGAVVGGTICSYLLPGAIPSAYGGGSVAVVLLGGFLVGVGTRIGNGCTSGHGVCGFARLSKRSILATLVFVVAGVIAVALMNTMHGGA